MGGHVHVAGVAGVGMSALAQALRWSHDRVTGSDRFHDRGQDLPIFAPWRPESIVRRRVRRGRADYGGGVNTAIEDRIRICGSGGRRR